MNYVRPVKDITNKCIFALDKAVLIYSINKMKIKSKMNENISLFAVNALMNIMKIIKEREYMR